MSTILSLSACLKFSQVNKSGKQSPSEAEQIPNLSNSHNDFRASHFSFVFIAAQTFFSKTMEICSNCIV